MAIYKCYICGKKTVDVVGTLGEGIKGIFTFGISLLDDEPEVTKVYCEKCLERAERAEREERKR